MADTVASAARRLVLSGALGAMLLLASPAPGPAQDHKAGVRVAEPEAQVHVPARAGDPRRPRSVAEVRIVRELAISRWLRPGEYAWNDEGVPNGDTVIVVNIRARVLSVYRGGVEIGRSSIIYGADNKPTPTGTFPILEKDADHVSNLYDAEMPWMLRLTWDGIAIHGSPVGETVVTHGCVGIPDEFAELLFREAKKGDLVMVTNGWMAGGSAPAAATPAGAAA